VTAIVIGMVLVVIVALVVISVFSEEEDYPTADRAAWADPDESTIDDLLHE
jgi:multisubunit Na+/H+ antiporter MnhC subunit